jgi:hypothetical protein
MTNFITSRSAIVIAGLMTFGTLTISSMQAQASSATSLGQCRAFTKEKVVRCCDDIVKNVGEPLWMRESHSSCRTAAVCVGGTVGLTARRKVACYIRAKNDDNQGHNNPPPPPPKNNPNTPGVAGNLG